MPGQQQERRAGGGANYQPQVTTEQLGIMINGGVNKLLEAIKAGNTEHLTSYLAFSSRFHKYSPRNQQLIYEQAPFATRVASYATWKAEGYQVKTMNKDPKKGKVEKGISILVPIPPPNYKAPERRSQRASEMQDEEKDLKTVGFVTSRFKVGTVFDKSMLIPEDAARVPDFFSKIAGDHELVYQRVVQAVKANGIQHREDTHTYGAQGYNVLGLIVVRPDVPISNRLVITLHEWTHNLLHKEEERRTLPKKIKECHAEAGAFIVANYLGIDVPYSADYLRNWGNDEKSLRQELDLVTFAASHMIQKIEEVMPPKEKPFDIGGDTDMN